jgi:hypothetical protein
MQAKTKHVNKTYNYVNVCFKPEADMFTVHCTVSIILGSNLW